MKAEREKKLELVGGRGMMEAMANSKEVKRDIFNWLLLQSTGWRLFAFSLLLHLLLVFVIHHYRSAQLWENGMIADFMWNGKGFAAGFSIPDELTSWQAPGYPWLLVGSWQIFGYKSPEAHLAISLLQVLAVASLVFPMMGLTRIWFGQSIVPLAGWIAVLMPLWLWYPTRLHHTALVMAFQPWLLWGWLLLGDKNLRNRTGLAVGLGLATGLAGLFQPVMLGIFGLISGTLFLKTLIQRQVPRMAGILGAGFLTLLVLLPWTLRNYHVHGKWMLVKDSFGKEFWMGNNPHATGTGYAEGGMEEITNRFPPKAFELRGKIPEIEMMAALQKEAVEYVKAEPGLFLERTGQKILWFWTLTPVRFERSSGDAEAHVFRWVQAGYWFAFIVLAVIAFFRPGWSREYLALVLLYAVLYSLIYGMTHVGQARFRGEMEFILVPAVAAGMVSILRRVQSAIVR